MSGPPSPDDDARARRTTTSRRRRVLVVLAYSLVLILVSALVTHLVTRADKSSDGQQDGANPSLGASTPHPVDFGAERSVVDTVTVPAGAGAASLIQFDAQIDATPTSTARAALVSLRVECRDSEGVVDMQSTGVVSKNVFLAHGDRFSGQALTPETDEKLTCSLIASAPYIDLTEDGLSSLPVRAEMQRDTDSGTHRLALRRLDDATLVSRGTNENVLSLKVADAASLDRMSTTVRLTSCTVVGGSRDHGADKCQKSMTGKESSTVRMRVIARWLDSDGEIIGTTTYWDETLAVDYSTHHLPWTLRQTGMADQVPEDATAAVLVVQAENVAGTPFVVHSDGTDSVVTTNP